MNNRGDWAPTKHPSSQMMLTQYWKWFTSNCIIAQRSLMGSNEQSRLLAALHKLKNNAEEKTQMTHWPLKSHACPYIEPSLYGLAFIILEGTQHTSKNKHK